MALANFRNKLNFEKKQIQFIERIYELKTDHKTGLLLQELAKENMEDDTDEKMLKLLYGEKQYNELMEELEAEGAKSGAVNYIENMKAVMYATLSLFYNRPYEEFEKAGEESLKK